MMHFFHTIKPLSSPTLLLCPVFLLGGLQLSAQADSCIVNAGNDTTVCSGTTIQLNATPGFDTYSWSPATGLSDPTLPNPVASITTDMTYVVTASVGAPSTNLINNSDFALGNTGFSSGHFFTSTYSPGNYYVNNSFFGGVYFFNDHTPTADNMFMSVDGAMFSTYLYETTVPVITPGTNYAFSFWTTRCDIGVPFWEIHYIGDVTGDQIVYSSSAIPAPPPVPGSIYWDQYTVPTWNSGPNTSVTIRINNFQLDGYGNDFAMDDMEFRTTGCNITDTVVITALTPNITISNSVSECLGESSTLTASGGSAYTWNTGDTTASITVSPATSTTYYVIGENVNGCTDSLTVHVTVVPPPVANITGDDSLCLGESTTLTASGGIAYLWNTGEGSTDIDPTPAASTVYSVIAINATNCRDTAYYTVQVTPIPLPPGMTNDTTVCEGSSLPVLQAAGQNIVWYTGSTVSATAPFPYTDAPGTYLYAATQTVNGCVSEKAETSVEVIAIPFVDLPESLVLCVGDTVTIGMPANNSWAHSWMDGLQTSTRPVKENGIYTLTAFNSCGTATDSCEVTIDQCECYFYLPNAFSPNADGMNEVFKPVYSCRIDTYVLRIFDRWGEVVFQSNDPEQAWDGWSKGLLSQQDVYVVLVQYIGLSGTQPVTREYRGHVTVLR